MTDDRAAFRATIHGLRTVPSRKVIQLILECPIEQQAEIARIAEHGAWVAVARIDPTAEIREEVVGNQRVLDNDRASGAQNDTPPRSDRNPKPVGAEKPKRDWREMGPAQQAGIRCNEKPFWTFLNEAHAYAVNCDEDAAEAVRDFCGVNSRAQLETIQVARAIWHQLDSEYRVWKEHPELVA